MVLGYDSADNRDIALKLMEKLKLTFPCILDSSLEAQQLPLLQYHTSAVPTTYIIDREGKILRAWVGFEEDDEQTKAAIKAIGLE